MTHYWLSGTDIKPCQIIGGPYSGRIEIAYDDIKTTVEDHRIYPSYELALHDLITPIRGRYQLAQAALKTAQDELSVAGAAWREIKEKFGESVKLVAGDCDE